MDLDLGTSRSLRQSVIQCAIGPPIYLTLGLPSFFCNTGYQGGWLPPPWISCLVLHIITCNIAMDSAFISAQNGIFSCTLCECTSKLHCIFCICILNYITFNNGTP